MLIKDKMKSSKKKVLYIHHGKGLGGAPLSLLYLIESLDKQKFHPIVLFLHDSEVVSLYKSKGIEVVGPINEHDFPHTKIWWLRWYHLHHFFKSFYSTIKTSFYVAPFWLKKIKPDLIHLNTSSLIAWGYAANKLKIPVIWHVREPLASGYFGIRRQIVQTFVAKYATKILPICKNDAKPWENNFKTNVVYNAVDLKLFDPSRLPRQARYPQGELGGVQKMANQLKPKICKAIICEKSLNGIYSPTVLPEERAQRASVSKGFNEKKILFLGGLSKEKGTLLIFKAFKKLLEKLPDAKLIVAGYFDVGELLGVKKFFPAQKYKKEVNKILKDIKNNITFLGPIKNVAQVMAECDVLVFPATVGHFARPIIEASCMAKPVIASNLPPLNELVWNGKTGFLIDTDEIDLWVEKLYNLLTDKELNQKMGQAGFDFATKKFDVKLQIQIIEKIYLEVLGRNESGKIKKRSKTTLE